MDVEYTPRGEAGWRKRGRRPTPVPDHLMTMIRTALADGTQANIDIRGVPPWEVDEVMRLLRTGCRHLKVRLRPQIDQEKIRFWVEERKQSQ